MGHAHAHAHAEGEGTYFLDQLFTILACGAIGLVAILMYQTGLLGRILVPMFFPMVLAGGIAIVVMAVIRAIAVWQLAGARRAAEAEAMGDRPDHGHSHGHSHAHGTGEACGHDHAHEAHDHGHSHDHAHGHAGGDDEGHDHGWAPWRYMVLAIPVFLFLLGLPRPGYSPPKSMDSHLQQGSTRKSVALLAGALAYPKTQPRRLQLRFKELTEAAAFPVRHELYEGDIGVIRGRFRKRPDSDREFSLFRVNMTCCAADAVYLETRIIAPDGDALRGIEPDQWVQVEGIISFQQNEKGKWIPVITLQGNDAIDPNAEGTSDVNSF
jgi:DUF1980 C-terminal domain